MRSLGASAASTDAAALPIVDRPASVGDQGADHWPSIGRSSDENYFSPLTQINSGNVQRLRLAWFIDLPVSISALSTPLEIGGVLYFAVGYSYVYAADAASGKILWLYDPHVTEASNDKLKAAWGIRGLAYADQRLFVGTQDGRLIALSTANGKLLWSVSTTEPGDGRYITGAPRVFNGKVIIGHGGADRPQPVRGYVTTYDAATGHKLWRFFLVPGNPTLGFENAAMEMAAKTWTGEWWKHGGGGTAWNALTYDAKYNRVYIGTGNGQPWNRNVRSAGGGDNLFLSCIVALDADTGEYLWHYQTTPGESWDYNSAMDMELATLTIDGRARDVILHAPKNGFFYVIDRVDGRLVSAEAFSKVTWADHIDTATGRPVETSEARFPRSRTLLYPGGQGAHSWMAMSYSPVTQLVYIPTISGLPGVYDTTGVRPSKFDSFATPTGFAPPLIEDLPAPDTTPLGLLQAWDPVRKKRIWSVPTPDAFDGGVLSTAGNLVFQGTERGTLEARAADTGQLLWTADAQNGVLGQPISYRVPGAQYIAVIAGYGASPALFGPIASRFGWQYRTQQRRVLAYRLDGTSRLPAKRSARPEPILAAAVPGSETETKRGGVLFALNCLLCHGAGAVAGGSAPDLRASQVPLTADAFAAVVRGGLLRARGMADFHELNPGDVEAIRSYIRSQAMRELAKQGVGAGLQ